MSARINHRRQNTLIIDELRFLTINVFHFDDEHHHFFNSKRAPSRSSNLSNCIIEANNLENMTLQRPIRPFPTNSIRNYRHKGQNAEFRRN
jgi:hypothetical protein